MIAERRLKDARWYMRKMVLRRKDYIVAAWLCALVSSPCPSFAQIGNDGLLDEQIRLNAKTGDPLPPRRHKAPKGK